MSVTRNAPVEGIKVVEAYVRGVRANKTNAEIAADLGMNLNTFTVRISQLRKKFAADAKVKTDKGETVVNPFDGLKRAVRKRAENVFDTNAETLKKLAEIDS